MLSVGGGKNFFFLKFNGKVFGGKENFQDFLSMFSNVDFHPLKAA